MPTLGEVSGFSGLSGPAADSEQDKLRSALKKTKAIGLE